MDKLNELYNKWSALLPLNERKEHLLSKRFTVEYNFNSNHIEGNTLTYGQTELLLLFGKVSGEGDLKDFMDMKASEVSVRMLQEAMQEQPDITIEQLAQRAGIVTAAVKKQLRQMTDKGYIQRRDQGGDWLVFASPSV